MVVENGTIPQIIYDLLLLWRCKHSYLAPFARYVMLKNIVTLKIRSRVTHPANLYTICTSLDSTDLDISDFC